MTGHAGQASAGQAADVGPASRLPTAEFIGRMRRLRAWQRRERLDALLVTEPASRRYFSGLTASNGALLLENDAPPVFYTDFRYLTMARRQVGGWLEVQPIWRPSDERETLAGMGADWRRVGYEGKLGAARHQAMREALSHVEWTEVSGGLAGLRAVKSPREVRLIRAAVAANDRLFEAVCRGIRPGMSEWSIRNLARREADRLGQGEAFEPVVCVGRNAAECHHAPDETLMRRNRLLLLDLGARKDDYCSDMTRSFFWGTPPPLLRDVHRVVLEANRRAIRAIRPGRPCHEIDAIARTHLARAGWGEAFGHSLGHGLGLEVHESPSFASGCETRLEPGMTLTVEPGVYLPGRLGVRIEDVILVTRDGCETLSRFPRGLSFSG